MDSHVVLRAGFDPACKRIGFSFSLPDSGGFPRVILFFLLTERWNITSDHYFYLWHRSLWFIMERCLNSSLYVSGKRRGKNLYSLGFRLIRALPAGQFALGRLCSLVLPAVPEDLLLHLHPAILSYFYLYVYTSLFLRFRRHERMRCAVTASFWPASKQIARKRKTRRNMLKKPIKYIWNI